MTKTEMYALAFVAALVWGSPSYADAQVQPAAGPLTMGQIETLNTALLLLDQGSFDQCPAAKEDKDAKAPPQRPCPFHRSVALLKVMARDIVALKPLDDQYKMEQNGVRSEVVAAFPIPSGITDLALKAIQGQQDISYLSKMQTINAERPPLPALSKFPLSDLEIGDPPEHNRISAEELAALAPVIEDLTAAK